MRLQATIQATGKSTTGVVVPDAFVDALGPSRHPAVRVTIRGYTFRSSIARMRGAFMLPITAETRAAAGVAPGDEVDLDIELDREPREVALPADLEAALRGDEVARRAFDRLSYSNQRRLVIPIEGARTEETRQRRIARTVADLREGRT